MSGIITCIKNKRKHVTEVLFENGTSLVLDSEYCQELGLKEGAELDDAAIRAMIADNLEPYKIPKMIVTVDEIIKTFNGKIDRKQMIAKYA